MKKETITPEYKDSTVLSKPEHNKNTNDKKPRSIKKIALTVFIVLILVLVVIPFIIVKILTALNGTIVNDGTARLTYSQLLQRTEPTDYSDELFTLKNPEITDIDGINRLVNYLQIDSTLGEYTVSVKSDQRPYELTLNFKLSHDESGETGEIWNQRVIKYSCAIMSLMDDISQVNWQYPDSNGNNKGNYFTRADAESFYNLHIAATKFAESSKSVQLMLNQLGIELYH